MSNTISIAPPGPRALYSLVEFPRALMEMSSLLPAAPYLKRLGGGNGEPVMVLPGFGADDFSTTILRKYLNLWGYDARPWGIGQNLDPRTIQDTEAAVVQIDENLEKIHEQLEQMVDETGSKVSLIGWSLGGIVSRQLASRHPELVERVITMGTPFGDFRSTVVFPLMQRWLKAAVEQADVDSWMELAGAPIGDIPLTVIYSNTDGFVPPAIARCADTENVEFIELMCSHVGFGVHPLVYKLLANRLAQKVSNWQAFKPGMLDGLLYRAG